MNSEEKRLQDTAEGKVNWKRWGPYLSERQWGTVREDYSENGDAWNYFPHDQARSRAYRWGEDGLAGISDDRQHLCFALALWNGKDPILKERLFGLSLLFTENETNTERIFGVPNRSPYVKDGIENYLLHGKKQRECRDLGVVIAKFIEDFVWQTQRHST